VTFECNIGAKGRAVRLLGGVVLALAGCLGLLAWALPTGDRAALAVSLACVAAGAFMIFEARAGWCVVRAMGFRTPI